MGRGVERLKALSVQRLCRQAGLHCDGAGLYLRVAGPTAASWVYRYMIGGKAREMGLGSYPEITLGEARGAASQARKVKAQGQDPIAVKDAAKAAQRAEQARQVTFRHCATAYIAAHRPSWRNDKHAKQWDATLDTYAMPVIGEIPVALVDVAMVNRILEPIWTAKSETASRLRGRIEVILDWAVARGFRTGENPARWKGHLENLYPARSKVSKTKHHAALPYADMASFYEMLLTQNGTAALAMRFAILTAARTGEVTGAGWDEFDLEKAIWTIPEARMKAGRLHKVPLSVPVLELLTHQRIATPDARVLFANSQNKALSNMAMLEVLRRMGRGDLTVHGFRSTFRDWAAECTNFQNEVAEAALAHVVGDKVEAAYRRGDLFEKRRRLMNAWAEFCTTTMPEGQVIPIRQPLSPTL